MRTFEATARLKTEWNDSWLNHQMDIYNVNNPIFFFNPSDNLLKKEWDKKRESDWKIYWENIKPKRATEDAACYDFYATKSQPINGIFKNILKSSVMLNMEISRLSDKFNKDDYNKVIESKLINDFLNEQNQQITPTLVMTGIKVTIESYEEMFALFTRSGNAYKKGWQLENGLGVIDFGYYNNINNEGELGFLIVNMSYKDYILEPGDRIGQGTWIQLKHADESYESTYKRKVRKGGFGHSGDKDDHEPIIIKQ